MVNAKIYVGWTKSDFKTRWSTHCRDALKYNTQWHLSCSIRFYKPESFRHQILNEVNSEKEAKELEIYYIATLCSYNPEIGYNMTMGGEGVIPNQEMLERNRQRAIIQNSKLSQEERKKVGQRLLTGRRARPEYCPKETRDKIGKSNSQKTRPKELRQHLAEMNTLVWAGRSAEERSAHGLRMRSGRKPKKVKEWTSHSEGQRKRWKNMTPEEKAKTLQRLANMRVLAAEAKERKKKQKEALYV